MTFLPDLPRRRVVAALIRRDLMIHTSYRGAFLMDLLFGLVSLVIYFFISRVLRPIAATDLSGARTFFDFAAVGVAITTVVQAATTALARRLREEQLSGTLEALVTQPVSTTELAVGFAGFPFLFAIFRVLLYLGVSVAFLDLYVGRASWAGFAVTLLLSGLALSSFGVSIGALTLVFKRGEAAAPLLVLALGFGGGAFFPLEALPDWMKPLTFVVPTRFVFEGIRNALFLGYGWGGDAVVVATFALLAVPLALWLFGRAFRHAIRAGTLGQY